ncbi:hypothetical protein N7456_010945 [Penicillium angulare]|uniref:Uncharacterized protein n=1 Tax=Penicillium angulare TaxID=116970 RepID=A0A9W9JZ88_9EURO|nr:hypothetical protein N7456_010945 [Penicillium angulare]
MADLGKYTYSWHEPQGIKYRKWIELEFTKELCPIAQCQLVRQQIPTKILKDEETEPDRLHWDVPLFGTSEFEAYSQKIEDEKTKAQLEHPEDPYKNAWTVLDRMVELFKKDLPYRLEDNGEKQPAYHVIKYDLIGGPHVKPVHQNLGGGAQKVGETTKTEEEGELERLERWVQEKEKATSRYKDKIKTATENKGSYVRRIQRVKDGKALEKPAEEPKGSEKSSRAQTEDTEHLDLSHDKARSRWVGVLTKGSIVIQYIQHMPGQYYMHEVTNAIYSDLVPENKLQYIFVNEVVNIDTRTFIQEDLYGEEELTWPQGDDVPNPRRFEYKTPEYHGLLGTDIGRFVARVVLGRYPRGTCKITSISVGISLQFKKDEDASPMIDLMFEIEPTEPPVRLPTELEGGIKVGGMPPPKKPKWNKPRDPDTVQGGNGDESEEKGSEEKESEDGQSDPAPEGPITWRPKPVDPGVIQAAQNMTYSRNLRDWAETKKVEDERKENEKREGRLRSGTKRKRS